MRVEKEFNMTEEEFKKPELFRNRIVNFIVTKYGCRLENANEAVKSALAYDWATCYRDGGCVGVQCSLDRTKVYVGL